MKSPLFATVGDSRVDLNTCGEIRLPAGVCLSVPLAAGGHWYGHGFSHSQPYPLERGRIATDAFAVNNIQSPVWMCSTGCLLFADTQAPLTVRINAGGDGFLRICCPGEPIIVRIFRGENLPVAHAAWLRHVRWPNAAPPAERFGDTLFCTWTQYPRCITQQRIEEMGRQIRDRGYPSRTIIIDDRWERCFGELCFAEQDFPDPRAMFDTLHALDFEVWLWVTPFVNVESCHFQELARAGVLVPDRSGTGAARLTWWGGTAGLVDVTAPQGRQWYRDKLVGLLELGADGFKIDGGDHKYHPPAADCAWHEPPGASGYSDQLLAIFEELVPNRCETRTAWLSQSRSILWREGGKDSHWELDNGLKAVATLGLHLGLLGYDLLIPDMVPGRVQTLDENFPLPTDELMIRWTELSAFFPLFQLSYFPWNYAPATAAAVLGFAHVHHALAPYLAAQSLERRVPLMRPLWYDWPTEAALHEVSDAFMLGSDIFVAPILDAGATSRDVPLPPGQWCDAWHGSQQSGHLRDWPAPCPGIPLFIRADRMAEHAEVRAALARIDRGSTPTGTSATWRAGLTRDLSVTG